MHLAVFVNTYPLPSQAFIRREIRELERGGLRVSRVAVRGGNGAVVDDADRAEAALTHYLPVTRPGMLAAATAATALARPRRFAQALAMALHLGGRGGRGRAVHLAYLAEACALLRHCRRDGVDHVHAHFGTNAAAVPLLCRLLGGPPYSFTVHGPEEFDRPEALGLGLKARHAAFVAAISGYCRGQLLRWCAPEDWSRIHVVRCGVDGDYLDTPPPDIASAPRLVCLGRLCAEKGQVLLVEAAARLRDAGYAFEIRFLGDGEARPEVEAAIARHGLADRCILEGWATGGQVRAGLAEARALVLPSLSEGLPAAIMEALALGRPVVSTWVAGIPELVEDGRSGWLAPPGCLDGLERALRAVLDADPATLTAMGAHGARQVRERHDVRVEAARLAGLFRNGHAGHGPPPRA